ncbi:hypothetical protein LXL04_000730 [Taraxacum kok-saghyz]
MSYSRVNLTNYLIPLYEIISATENFSQERCIGGGGFGLVYRGQLSESWKSQSVAVKRLAADSHQGEHEFRNELDIISSFQHENIIAFIGYCDEGDEMIIVYEYALNGSLNYHLEHRDKISRITWAQRLEICIGAARGLHYLHSGLGEKNKVIHRDIKSANILLDDNMVAKISDFGLSKLHTRNQLDTRFNTKVAGSRYYLDPTYGESGILQKESDIYSFGVVLFEIMSGMLVYRERRTGNEPQLLMNMVRRMERDNIIDPDIRDHIKDRSLYRFKEIAYQCISLNLTERPTLDTVIKKLEEALNIQIFEHSDSTPADSSMIENLISRLNSVSLDDQRNASRDITLLTKYRDENRVAFADAGAIPRLTHLLTAPDSHTREHSMTALLNLSRDKDNKGIIISSGAVPGIVHMLKKGSNVSRENAASIIYRLSEIKEADVPIGSSGAIAPLVSLLSEGTTRGKKSAADSLNNLCLDKDNRGRALQEGLVPILMKLLTEPHGVLKEKSVALLARLSKYPEGSFAIGEAEAVPHLVEVIGSGSKSCDENAVRVLEKLCSMDEKYLVEAKENGVMEKLKNVQQHGTNWGKMTANELQRKIKDHHGYVSLYNSNTEVVNFVGSGSSGSMMFVPDPTDSRLKAKAKRGAIKVSKITALNPPQIQGATAVYFILEVFMTLQVETSNLLYQSTIIEFEACLINPHVRLTHDIKMPILQTDVLEIIHTLEKGSKEAREHAAAIYNLYVIRPGSTITSQGAIPPLMLMLGEGTTTGKMNAAVSLFDLCKTSVNRERVLRAGVVPVLMELLKEPQVELKEMYLTILRELFRHPEGKLAIGEAEAVRHLLEFIGSGTDICDNYAVAVLDELCSMDEKYLVEAQEYGAMEKLKYVRTAYAKSAANDIQNKIKYHEQGALKYFFDKVTNIHL